MNINDLKLWLKATGIVFGYVIGGVMCSLVIFIGAIWMPKTLICLAIGVLLYAWISIVKGDLAREKLYASKHPSAGPKP